MARRLSKQQAARIAKRQQQQRDSAGSESTTDSDETLGEAQQGTVIIRHGKQVVVADNEQQMTPCQIRQNIGQIVCGDHVVWHRIDEHHGIVSALEERHSALVRPDYSGRDKPIAANITQLVVVIAPQPEPTGYLIDQYLVTAELIGVKAVILLNKCDLLDDSDTSRKLEQRLDDYREIGYETIAISAKQKIGLEQLDQLFAGETSILVGQSGVGKSSLINRLIPDQEIQTGAISEATGLGRHTTSTTTLYRLPTGGRIIDSPGVRSFRLTINSREQLESGFGEFASQLGHCRFSNCSHSHEPDCALIEARDAGKIPAWRLEHFQQLADTLKNGRS
ncbi:small ribosomal subunit biogenesis GTPase RsgA [Solemya velum gill symbiont]|uniref:small ribosomal subunit biogenesis GTPase RsgA n=1 Tax=Solemya velum gill symbiont TaxID=2340 RepID=UPI00099735B3|nr:small ribosomal subunit biogenesis GTPase RsgA [Solemya velum gill symbiont]OOZ00178.1 ribosome small subunit-dependent GTPase A [Solemya velum gill symbiont]OOZ02337.1 ribosome small subunit-dependent GTPase A [Solemya velum gill symbiont]OOZ04694.1 ribosome small subunit-dependent GTPase A [Solemya velum gill symbiont]OOZ06933.1 ribosome small subunit-dependent GTPase A [Solemya velum gill symbiont]OOZ09116.1 ribosome small subunit-dependent GTPase A [Solemya velum gill symbiont]